jgi:hypothetical protein
MYDNELVEPEAVDDGSGEIQVRRFPVQKTA